MPDEYAAPAVAINHRRSNGMNNRQRAMAVLHYEDYDRLPLVHFGFWRETLEKWAREGHLSEAEALAWHDGSPADTVISAKLGFDFNWYNCFSPRTQLWPPIESKVLEELPDGSRKVLDGNGAIILQKPHATGIPSEVDHILKDRKAWEEVFLPRLLFSRERVWEARVNTGQDMLALGEGGLIFLQRGEWDTPLGLHCGSLYGVIRNWLGLVGSAYMLVDDEPLFDEIIDTVGDLCYQCTKTVLETGAKFDFAHFWEDISFKSGPLINPVVFREKVGPHYRRITDLVHGYGIDIVSLDSDGKIDKLIPVWFDNGVNTMFPIEVGTWGSNIAPWRAQYGRGLLGVGGMNKKVFAYDYAAIDTEVERLKGLVELGGYLPCPDHRIPPDAKWENVQYYCEQMHRLFG
jgi:uroporphyrinogen decarboxylase